MKKIFFALVAIFGLWSCVQEELPAGGNTVGNGEGGYVELSVGVVLPDMKEATRTMAAPAIERLHLLVFDDNGLLSEAVNAELDTAQNTEWGETSEPTYFKVKLARTDYKRTIHFVANSPIANVMDYPMSTEGNILTSLVVSGEQDAYWQRVVLPHGITGTQGEDANGNVIYVPTDEVKEALTNVPLVRNNSRVKVVNALTSDKTQLRELAFVLVNIPASGTVVPFNNNSGEFVNFTADTDYAELDAANYDGFEPANRDLINNTFTGGDLNCENSTAWVTATAANANSGYHYLYERNQKLEPAYVIVRGIYGTDTTPTYYKIDIINDKGVSYNLLRNIQYTVNITNVIGSGFATAEEAYNAGPTNNLNFSVETKNLLNLSDGESAFYVEYTQKVINQSGATVTLRYRYITNLSTSANNTDAVVITKGEGEVISGDIADGDNTTDGYGWNTMSFTAGTIPAEGESAKTQIVTLTAGSFARNVEFILTRPYTFKLDVPKKVAAELGSPVAATLELEERLPMGIFPLEFVVVAENNSLSPDATLNTLPVVTGLNVDGTPGGQHFGYKVTYEWDQYYSVSGSVESYNTIIPLYFKTNMADSAPEVGSADGTDCYAYNQYHNIATDEFYNGDLYALSLELASTSVQYGLNREIKATLRLPESIAGADWTNGQYLDFAIKDSNSTLKLINVENGAQMVTIDGVTYVRVLKSTFDGGTRVFPLTFNTTKFRSATTITASNDNFTQASATLTNTGLGTLGIEVTEGDTLLPGAGQTVAVEVTVPAGAEAAFENDKLELTLTTSAAYLENPETRASISGSGTIFKVVVQKSEYDNATGSTYSFDFTTTAGNTAATRTITVSHPYDYLEEASAQTTTSKYSGMGWTLGTLTSGTSGNILISLPTELDDSLFPLRLTITVTAKSRTNLYINNSGNLGANSSVTIDVSKDAYDGSKTISVPITATATNSRQSSSFTISLASDILSSPSNIQKTKNSSSNSYQ
ncbi:MAG: hypothetical protein J6R90_00570 [Alistipes sp.]|nr:hypothetical protein [Alistipes sp.]